MATAVLSPAYYGIRLSENIARTDEGFLICRNAVIGRTGFQKYRGRELPQKQLARLKLNYAPDEQVEIYRPFEEVFNEATLASFEGKPVTDGHPGGETFVDCENVGEYSRGHLQNVHQAEEPLESGDWAILADVVITHAELIRKVEHEGLRELSCGYGYDLEWRDGKLCQVNITGNHVAVVPRGRAGAEARIVDSATGNETKSKEKRKMAAKRTAKEWLKFIIGAGLRAHAQDAEATPEEIGEAVDALRGAGLDVASETGTHTETKAGGVTTDAAMAAKDAEIAELKEKLKDKKAKDGKGKGKDKGKRGKDETEEEREEELSGRDAEHAADCEAEDCTGDCMDSEESEEEREEREAEGKDKKGKGKDAGAVIVEPFAIETERAPRGVAADEVLEALKPHIAKTKDRALMQEFNRQAERVNRRGVAGNSGSYAAAERASGARAKDSGTEEDRYKALNEDAQRRHRVNPTDVTAAAK